ncbi:MAG: tRNA dihydrouridine synthase DusB [Burkholderiales bacterium]|nr:tRNA dihydrouridine synthase DusB [Burkholderiales bacterium]
MRIGPYSLKNRLVVAPMAGVTDRPFRSLCRRFGAGHAISEMVASKPELWQTPKSMRRMNHDGEAAPITVQIAGSDPQVMADAARFNVARGAQIIDINMGCPKKKVCRVDAGSALLRDEALVARILAAVVAAVDVPVTLKTRTGWSPDHRNALRIAQIAEEAGIAALTLHGRTRACGFDDGTVEYDSIRAVKAAVSIPVIANGDIDSPHKAKAVLDYTGADAVMIGRAAQGRPWIFRDAECFLATGEVPPSPAVAEVAEVMHGHLIEHYALYGAATGVRSARKHIGWYSDGLPGGDQFRDRLNRIDDADAQLAAVRDYFSGLAAEHDRLPLTPYVPLAWDASIH